MKPFWRAALACLLCQFAAVPAVSSQPAEDVPLLEAVLRYEIGVFRRESSRKSSIAAPSAFCVRIRATEGADPVDPVATLLARFKNHRPPVKPGSACTVKDWKVSDASSGRPAAILDVGPVARVRRASEAEVSGAPYIGGQVAREYLYRLRLKGTKWIVYDVETVIVTETVKRQRWPETARHCRE